MTAWPGPRGTDRATPTSRSRHDDRSQAITRRPAREGSVRRSNPAARRAPPAWPGHICSTGRAEQPAHRSAVGDVTARGLIPVRGATAGKKPWRLRRAPRRARAPSRSDGSTRGFSSHRPGTPSEVNRGRSTTTRASRQSHRSGQVPERGAAMGQMTTKKLFENGRSRFSSTSPELRAAHRR